jgi:hypothetical protein
MSRLKVFRYVGISWTGSLNMIAWGCVESTEM